MKKVVEYFPKIVSWLLALLFIYAAASKILDFENFQVQIAQSPVLSAYAGFISYAVIIVELVLAILLCLPQSQGIALYGSLGLMSAFTIYIFLILNYSDFVPCSCGGILEKMGWKEHLIFNGCFVILIALAILLGQRLKGKSSGRTSLYSGLVVIVSCLLVLVLFQSSEYIIKKENNFTRRFLKHPILEDKIIKLKDTHYYFAGRNSQYIYLGSTSMPNVLLTLDEKLNIISRIIFRPDTNNYVFRNLRVQVQFPNYYFYDGTVPVIYKGKLGHPKTQIISLNDVYFNQFSIIDSTKFVIRIKRSLDHIFSLAMLSINYETKVVQFPNILQKQIDGVFDVDGVLTTDQSTKQTAYTYTYRNQSIIMDSSLNIKRFIRMIDTTSKANISIRKLSNGTRKIDVPSSKVNKNSTLNGNLLYNQSNLRGKHESTEAWEKSSIVDVYRTDQQKYIGSIYINDNKKQGISSMMASEKYLFILIGNELRRYIIRSGWQ